MEWFLAIGMAALAALGAAAATALALRGRDAAGPAELAAARRDRTAALAERDAAIAARIAAERESAAAQQQARDAVERLKDFERLKQESAQAAQAAALAAAQQLSSKLLDDHKRETVAARAEAEKRVQEVNAALVKEVEGITKIVSALDGQVREKAATLETVMRALSSPGGAGQLAELGLANALKSFGLELDRDFVLQHAAVDADSGRRLRPDAVVFLPSNTVLVIDCKASKFLLDIAEREGTEEAAFAYENLARTMNQHLKALAEKDYRSAVLAACRQAGRGGDIGRIISIMYLPNEAALEKLHRADPDFPRKARGAQIIPAGPAGLYCALSLASAEINMMRQVENQQEIVDRTRQLLEQVGVVLTHAGQVGRGIKAAAEAFARLSASVNARLLPRARGMTRLGVQPAKPLPQTLPSFSVHSGEEGALIEGEAAEVEAAAVEAAEVEAPEPHLLAE